MFWVRREGDKTIFHNILDILYERNHDAVKLLYVFISKNVKIRENPNSFNDHLSSRLNSYQSSRHPNTNMFSRQKTQTML